MQTRLLASKAETAATRRETVDDVEYVVVPVVVMVEGVRRPLGSDGPELVPAEELAKTAPGWNGRPVVFTAHPTVNSQPVTVNSPELQASVGGKLFRAQMDGNRLKAEAWIEAGGLDAIDGAAAIVERMEAGEVVEVSGAYFAAVEEAAGEWNGESYGGIQRTLIPDHLAIGVDIGACSVADGCGAPRANTAACCEACAKGETCMGKKPESTILSALRRAFGGKAVRANAEGESHRAIEDALNAALADANPGADWVWVRDVFPDQSLVIYDLGGQAFQRSYTIDANGAATLGGDPVEVIPETTYKPVSEAAPAEEKPVANQKRVDALIANAKTKHTEKDRTWLMACTDEQLDAQEPVEEPKKEEPPVVEPTVAAPVANAAKPLTEEQWLEQAPASVRAVVARANAAEAKRKEKLVAALKAVDGCPLTEEQLRAASVDELERFASFAKVEADPAPDYSGLGGPRANANDDEKPISVPRMSERFAKPAAA